MADITVVVAAHKKYRMPEDRMYLPVQAGAALSSEDLGFEKDDSGNNISRLNPSFCELTALYWAWKNIDSEYIGLVHYRRYFCERKTKDPFNGILRYKSILPYLGKYTVFLPQKRKYFIETLYSHYAHTHDASHLDLARRIISEKCPEYLPAFDSVMKQTAGYMFNMAIMRRDILDRYCSWLFAVLFELKNRMEEDEALSPYQGRLYGRVSELLLNVWIAYQISSVNGLNKGEIKELPFRNMEKTDYLKKAVFFLSAKFFGRKYKESF